MQKGLKRSGKIIFQSTPSVGRATTTYFAKKPSTISISIHALRGEGDVEPPIKEVYNDNFNPRPPWGGRPEGMAIKAPLFYFNPRPPWGGRPYQSTLNFGTLGDFNPRPPWGGRQQSLKRSYRSSLFQSTPSVGRATLHSSSRRMLRLFQSTPSVGRATHRHFQRRRRNTFQSTPSVGRATKAEIR